MKEVEQKLTLNQPATYQVKVPSHFDASWSDWAGGMRIMAEVDDESRPITTLTGTVDQAALLGLLRWLYSMGLPLISVTLVEGD